MRFSVSQPRAEDNDEHELAATVGRFSEVVEIGSGIAPPLKTMPVLFFAMLMRP